MSTFMAVIQTLSVLAIPALVLFIVLYAAVKKVKVYEAFIEGAKEGFQVGVRIIPYLVAMLVAVGVFRAGGGMDLLARAVAPVTDLLGMPVDALPMAVMRPLSGSGALGVMSEIIASNGADSFVGRLVSVMMGSGETTFYVLAVYFGSVSVSRTRHAVPAGIVADLVSIFASLWIARAIFG